tara:strand:+ start:261 stop:422 length:162 start_codon:yes stop_codon:yes gene_type:complete
MEPAHGIGHNKPEAFIEVDEVKYYSHVDGKEIDAVVQNYYKNTGRRKTLKIKK